MSHTSPSNLPAAASALLARRASAAVAVAPAVPMDLLRMTASFAASTAAATALLAHLTPGLQPFALVLALFAGLHVGLGGQASWKGTLSGLLPAGAVAHSIVPGHPAFGFLLIGGLLGWVAGWGIRDGVTRISLILGLGLASVLGAVAASAISGSELLAKLLPASALALLAGAGQGAILAAGTVPRHLQLERDPLELLYEETRVLPGAEMRDYVERSMLLYRRIRKCLAEGVGSQSASGLSSITEDLTHLMQATFGLARRWREIELFLEHADAEGTRSRLRSAEEKLASIEDAYARKQYEQVADSLRRRLEQLTEMSSGRERVIGSLSYYYTTLEDMHLSLMRLRASDAQSESLELNSLAERVRSLNTEVEATARSVEELDFGGDEEPTAQLPS